MTDEGADVLAAEIVEIHDRTATIRVRWDEILSEYQPEADGGE